MLDDYRAAHDYISRNRQYERYRSLDPAVDQEDLVQEVALAALESDATYDSVRGRGTKKQYHVYRHWQKRMQVIFPGHNVLVDLYHPATHELVETISYAKFRKLKKIYKAQGYTWRTRSRLVSLDAQTSQADD